MVKYAPCIRSLNRPKKPLIQPWFRQKSTSCKRKLVALDAELKRRDLKILQLTLELAYLKRVRFGCKSEALTAEQRDLFLETGDEDGAAIVAELEEQQNPAEMPRPHKRSGRNPLPPELPRIEHRHEPESCTCGACGRELVKIGGRHQRTTRRRAGGLLRSSSHSPPQYACRTCETVTAAPVPAALIDGSLVVFDYLAGDNYPDR